MKKTTEKSKFNLAKAGIISAVIFAVLFALRLYQLIAITDPVTGFFTDHKNITIIPMYVIAILSVIAVAVMCYKSSDKPLGLRYEGKDYFHAATSLFFAIATAIDSYQRFREIAELKRMTGSISSALVILGGYTKIIIPVAAALSAFVFIADFASAAAGKNYMKNLKIPMLFPVIWAFFLTVSYFTITASYIKVAQLMFTIFADAFLILFLFEYARMNSGIGRQESVWAFYATGIITVGLTLISTVPTLFFELFAPEKVVVHCPFRLYSLAAMLFAVSAMINVARGGKEKAEEDTELAEENTITENTENE